MRNKLRLGDNVAIVGVEELYEHFTTYAWHFYGFQLEITLSMDYQ
jgi:hypothetical protein